MRILVTGGAGFIGSNFVHYILKNYPKYKVINLDLLTYAGNLENLVDIESSKNYKFVKGDITDPIFVNDVTEGVDVIVNFAAESHVDKSIILPLVSINTNVLGTQVLLEVARRKKIRFHQVSTDEVFGDLAPDEQPFNETTRYNPSTPYAASKAAADHLVRAYVKTYNLEATISNCSNNYGPYQFPEKLHGIFITNLLENKKIYLHGDGLQIRDWLYVEDHCRAIDMIIHKGRIGETYCVGGNDEITNLEVAKIILRLMGKDEKYLEFVNDRPGNDKRYAIDFYKIHNELGWEPKMDFEDGVKSTIEWYKKNEDWWKKIKSGEYMTYYQNKYKY